jgi:uncharacterized membrane protein YadS
MVVYPVLADTLALSELATGVFLGGSIHDVSHVVGASFGFGPAVMDYAMIVKMLRVACLIPVAWLFMLMARRRGEVPGARSPRLPWFLVAFVVIALVNNLAPLPAVLIAGFDALSRACFVLAIAALGVRTALRDLLAVGWPPVALVLAESTFLGVLALSWARTL